MNCNAIIAGFFSGCSLKSYRLQSAVWCLVMALRLFDLWISGRTRTVAIGPVRGFLCMAVASYNVVLACRLLVGVLCPNVDFQPFISLLHSNSGYDLLGWTARNPGGNLTYYWLIIPAIAVQKAYKRLKINKTFL